MLTVPSNELKIGSIHLKMGTIELINPIFYSFEERFNEIKPILI